MSDFGVDSGGQLSITRTQALHLIIARFTLGFWILGIPNVIIIGSGNAPHFIHPYALH